MVNAFAGVEPRLSDTWTLPIIARFQFDLGSIREGSLPLSPRLEVGLRWYPGGNLKENHDSQESENE